MECYGVVGDEALILQVYRIALAAMDSEPVAYISKSDFDAGYPHILARRDFNKACTMPVYAAQPAPVVPELRVDWQENEFSAGWNACRAAMLQELKKSAGTEAICRSDENVQVLHTKSPAQSDCCPAQNVVVPAQSPIDHGYLPECECSGCKATARICTEMAVNSLVIPNEMTSEQAYEIGYYYGDPVDVFARGANWMRQHIIDSTLAAAPQLPGSDPATVPGKWVPVSEQKPDCWCRTCRPVFLNDMRFVVCPDCGNKRCPRANDHRNACTGSNEPGQEGSAYPAAPQEVKGE
ncbi:hypothetical protein NOV78_11950 [Klebsiella pneumoniae]|nr:hypothetical protein [Klebsiella pneumoniae]MCX0282253.1 hypothetical protein [Klebsiella pneumoniae]WGF01247.1 hypothetical protein LQ775_19575 [Klebsiella pneumoniae]